MQMSKKQQKGRLVATQILLWACVLAIPYITALLFWGDGKLAGRVFFGFMYTLLPLMLLYFLNFFLFIPRFLFGKRKCWFYILNALIVLAGMGFYLGRAQLGQDHLPQGFSISAVAVTYILTTGLLDVLAIFLALGVRYMMRWNEMQLQLREEEKQKKEAELTWLKYQLNPHFLFNTMNNISSLTQIDPDQAQESIGKLSDVLRYALYETDNQMVALSGEMEFMRDYISLMQLRCNELSEVSVDMEAPSVDVQIAPLLYISLIENAFKHGVNARLRSFVSVRLRPEGGDLVFECTNSLFRKAGEEHIGSGIGLENLKQRLELLYPGRYSYGQQASEGVYSVKLVLKDLIPDG